MNNNAVTITEEVKKKWSPIVESKDLETGEDLGFSPISDRHMKNTMARLLENQVREGIIKDLTENNIAGDGTAATGAADNWDPVLISMIRQAMPQMIVQDLMGMQAMTGPTGLVFAMSAEYQTTRGGKTAGDKAFADNTIDPAYSGSDNVIDTNASGDPMLTATAEVLGSQEVVDATSASTSEPVAQETPWAEMGFKIDKTSVTAGSRALKAHYTDELAQDLRVIHGLDAEQELASILTTEVVAEINREMITILRAEAEQGAQWANAAGTVSVDTQGTPDTDARWEGEAYGFLAYSIQREANAIGLATRRGRGNWVVTSADVASALEFSGKLRADQNLANNITNTAGIGVSFVGTLAGGTIKVYVDPYLATHEVLVGYKGSNPYDAGYFYCPYTPLQMYRARGEEDFQPRIGFKTRYGTVGHPQHKRTAAGVGNGNHYYRKFTVVM